MGVRVTVAGKVIEVTDYSISQDSTPIKGDDSSGSVGDLTIRTPHQPNIYEAYGAEITILDNSRGFISGKVDSVSREDGSGLWVISGPTRLGETNLYNIQAKPFIGTLRDAFSYYLSLAGIEDGWVVEPEVANVWITAPGWFGELWYHMKQLVIAAGAEIVLTDSVIRVRQPRQTSAVQGYSTDRNVSIGGPDLAQFVEVYHYDVRTLEDEPIYPPFGHVDAEEILTFTAGEVTEFDLELNASVLSYETPTMVQVMDRDDMSASQYLVSDPTGTAISPSQFRQHGGYVKFELGEDTRSLIVTARGPVGIRDSDNKFVERFSFSFGKKSENDTTGSSDGSDDSIFKLPDPEYPTLRILGTGVEYNPTVLRFPTGIPDTVTDNEVGITVDNPFIRNAGVARKIGRNLASKYSSAYVQLEGTITEFLDTGLDLSSAEFTFNDEKTKYGNLTFDQLVNEYAGMSFDEAYEYEKSLIRDDGIYHMIGNAIGTRIWDEESKHWFRVRSATIEKGPISYQADPDTLVKDAQKAFQGKTCQEIQEANQGLTYQQVRGKGLQL